MEIQRHRLKNGLTILSLEDHSVPVVTYQAWFKTGSKNERQGNTGIAHLFEHMMFKGSKKYGPEEHARIVQANGGRLNAFTTWDTTVYFEDVAADKLGLIISLEAERMAHLRIDASNLKSEREVVKEERRMRVDNSPMGAVVEQFFAAAYQAHPYRWPVVGWMSDLDGITLRDCRRFFNTYYSPNNMVAVVVGDFETKKLLRLMRRYYGWMKPAREIPRVHTVEPEQHGERRVKLRKVAQLPMFLGGYHIPAARHQDLYPLKVAARVLSAGNSSRLYRRLVYEEQVATYAAGGVLDTEHPGVFYAAAGVRPGVETALVERMFFEEVDRLKTEEIPEKELMKAKNQLEAEFWHGLRTAHRVGYQIGVHELIYGDHRSMIEAGEHFRAVTARDVMRVAREYFIPRNRTVVTLIPEGATGN